MLRIKLQTNFIVNLYSILVKNIFVFMTLAKEYNKSQIFALIAFSTLLATLVAFALSTNVSYEQQLVNSNPSQNSNSTNTNTISVTGSASTQVKPDKVIVSLGVITTSKSANAAVATNSIAANKVIAALKAAGIKDNETSTSSFTLSPDYSIPSGISPGISNRTIVGFTASNLIQIQTTNTNNASKWIDSAIASGANTIGSIDFVLSDKKLQETKANLIKQAIENAKTKADIAASAAGLKIIGIKAINVNEFDGIQPLGSSLPNAAVQTLPTVQTFNAKSTPVISGQERITTNAGVSFIIR